MPSMDKLKHKGKLLKLKLTESISHHPPTPNPATRLHNHELTHLIRSGRLEAARKFFEKLPIQNRNVVTYNSMLSGYIRHRHLCHARHLFDEMPHRDIVSWNSIISAYAHSNDVSELREGRELFERMPERDVVSWNTVITGYVRNGMMGEAVELFEKMSRRSVVSWNVMITGFLRAGDVEKAVELFQGMDNPDSATVSGLVSGLIRNGKLGEAEEILRSCGVEERIEGVVDAYNTLIAGYGQNRRVEDARRIFDLIPGKPMHGDSSGARRKFLRNVVSWNSMIMCYVRAGDVCSARVLFDEMPYRDLVSWNTMIAAYAQATMMDEAEALFKQMANPDTWTWNSMLCGFVQKGDVERAWALFENMPCKSLVSWNAMISGFDKNGYYQEAIETFLKMRAVGERPDKHTMSSMLSACAGLATWRLGTQIHQLITKTTLGDTPIDNALITMYSRCGNMTEAKATFDKMETQRDVVSWNAIIGGYAHHGQAKEALKLFEEMKRIKVMPTHLTFIAVLNACGHAGLVDEGRRAFESMVQEFGILARVEHYASLVDLIGRHGQLEDAMEVIKNMPIKPDKAVWGSLLGACRVHKNVALAQVAAEALAIIEPESSAPYVLVHNMHVDDGRWDNATHVRKKMDTKGVIKQPGYSWVELPNVVQLFISGDRSHPLSHEIFVLLESLDKIVKDAQLL